MGLERRFRFSTQAALLKFSCACLCAFACSFPPAGQQGDFHSARTCPGAWAHHRWWVMAGRRSRSAVYHRVSFAQLCAATHARYCCCMLAATESRAGAAVRVAADARQVVSPCMGGGVGPDISTPPQGGGGEGDGRR
jgi:hypothetical protein